MEFYLLGSLLGLGYYLNSNEELKDKKLNYPKRMYRGNIYDNEQYDKVENEIYDRSKKKFDQAQNIYENNVVGQYTPDVIFNQKDKDNYFRTLKKEDSREGFQSNIVTEEGFPSNIVTEEGFPSNIVTEEGFPSNIVTKEGFQGNSEFGNSIRKDFCYIDEDCNKIGETLSKKQFNKETFVNANGRVPNDEYDITRNLSSALERPKQSSILSWNDEGGIGSDNNLEEQFQLLGKGGEQGVKMNYEQPWHNNMVPFFGGTMKQNVDPLVNETKLNMYTGQWDYSKKQKKEIAPMFVPEKNIRNVYGDQQFLQKIGTNIDRYIPSLMRTNEAPTEKVFVAPGLNLGYMENPDFGFHDPVRALPKTTNELRAKNKPKLTYDKPIISGKSLTQEATKRMNVNKNRPELVVYNDKNERTFGAKAVVLGESGRPTYLLGRAIRSISKFFMGTAKDTGSKAQKSYNGYTNNSKKKNYDLNGHQGPAISSSTKKNQANFDLTKTKVTKRQTIEKNGHKGYFSSIFTAVTNYLAPAKETIKETTLHATKTINLRTTTKQHTLNYTDKAKNTIRETIENNTKNGNLTTNRKVGKAYNHDERARNTLRESTEINNHKGNLGKTRKVGKAYNDDEKARTTLRETTELNNHEGNLGKTRKVGKVYNEDEKARTTLRETTELNNHEGNLGKTRKVGKVYNEDEKARTTVRETTELNNHEGNIGKTRKVGKAYNDEERAKTTVRETTEMNDRKGEIQTSVKKLKVYDPQDVPNYTLKDTVKVINYKGILGNTEKKLKIYDPDDKARYTSRQDTLIQNYYGGKEAGQNNGAYEVIKVDPRYTSRQDTLIENYTGTAVKNVEAQQNYGAAYNAETNALKEVIAEGRAPTQNSVKVVNGVEHQNVEIKKLLIDTPNPRGMENDLPNVDKLYQVPPTISPWTITKEKNTVFNNYTERINPEILEAFRNNPYTQSLSSYAFP